MRPVRRSETIRLPREQRGVIAIASAVMMIALLAFLAITIDTGRLFLEKRTLQSQADLAALETARLYCRDQSMTEADRLAAAQATLSADRNNFLGDTGSVQVELGLISGPADENGAFKAFTADETGKAVRVTLSRTVQSSIFSILTAGPTTLTLRTQGVAEACQPLASLHIRSTLLTVDSSQSALLNSVLGGLLGTTLNLGVGQWDGLINTDLNLLNYSDALALNLGLDVGDYDSVLNTQLSINDFLVVAADVLQAGGNASTLTLTALQDLQLAIPPATPLLSLGELLQVQTASPDTALDVGLQLMQLVQGSIQLANSKSAIAADIPVSLLGLVNATIKLQVVDPPNLTAVGDPKLASEAPYSSDGIYVRSAQVRTFVSLDLPIVGATLNTLTDLLTSPLLTGVSGVLTSLLSLDIVGVLQGLSCVVYCDIQNDLLDIKVLTSPRLDILLEAGGGDGRVTQYDCDEGDKTLETLASTAAASIKVGRMGDTMADAATNAFAEEEPSVTPVPILDLGTKRIRYQCTILLICWTEYWDGDSWTNNPADAAREAFTGGGLGLRLDTDLLSGSQTLNFVNSPSDEFLPEFGVQPGENAYQGLNSDSLVSGLENNLLGLELEFYEPNNTGDGIGVNLLGGLLFLVGSAANALTDAISALLTSVLSPILMAIVDQLLDVLGIGLAETEIGATMSCESDRVQLVM